MAKFNSFEEIEAWQKGRRLAQEIRAVTTKGDFARDYSLRDQINRAAVSVPSNIAEGFERGGVKEFVQFLWIAKGSTGELRTQLYLALDAGYISKGDFDRLYALAAEVARMISGLVRYLRQSGLKGPKYV